MNRPVRKRILVVDDEKNIRLMLEQTLSTSGYEVVAAIDGEQALAKAQETAVDLVLLDMKLPGLDGIEVLRRLRRSNPTVPVVMITAHGTVETAVEAMKLGAVDYLRKPFRPDEIRTIVGKVLERHNLSIAEPAETVAETLEQAKLLLSQRRFGEAETMLRSAIANDPTNAEVLNLLGVGAELKGRLQEAAAFYRAALNFNPTYVPAQHSLHRVTQMSYSNEGLEAENLRPKQPEAGE